MARGMVFVLFWVLLIGMTGPLQASLIGDTVLLEHCWTTPFDTPWDSANVVVQAGNTDSTAISAHTDHNPTYYVDMESDQILIDFIRYTAFTAGQPFHGLVVSDLDWPGMPGTSIIDVVVSTNFSGWNNSRINYGTDWVTIDWQGLNVSVGTYFNITLTTSTPVPEPCSILLLLIAIGGLTLLRRLF